MGRQRHTAVHGLPHVAARLRTSVGPAVVTSSQAPPRASTAEVFSPASRAGPPASPRYPCGCPPTLRRGRASQYQVSSQLQLRQRPAPGLCSPLPARRSPPAAWPPPLHASQAAASHSFARPPACRCRPRQRSCWTSPRTCSCASRPTCPPGRACSWRSSAPSSGMSCGSPPSSGAVSRSACARRRSGTASAGASARRACPHVCPVPCTCAGGLSPARRQLAPRRSTPPPPPRVDPQVDGHTRRRHRAPGPEDPGRAGRGAAADAAAGVGGRQRRLRRGSSQTKRRLGRPRAPVGLRRRALPAEAGALWRAPQGGGTPARRRGAVADRPFCRQGLGARRRDQQRLAAALAHRAHPVGLQPACAARRDPPPPQAAPSGALAGWPGGPALRERCCMRLPAAELCAVLGQPLLCLRSRSHLIPTRPLRSL